MRVSTAAAGPHRLEIAPSVISAATLVSLLWGFACPPALLESICTPGIGSVFS